MTLRLQATAQWQKCAAKFLSIPAIILLFGKSLKCLYLSQISTDLYSVKKTPKSHTFPLFLSTHLTSSINIRKFQIWPRTFPLCIVFLHCNVHCSIVLLLHFSTQLLRLYRKLAWMQFQVPKCSFGEDDIVQSVASCKLNDPWRTRPKALRCDERITQDPILNPK